MKILIAGGKGFVGRHIASALRAVGHDCVITARKPGPDSSIPVIRMDYEHDHDTAFWAQHLAGFDAVINAAGILVERSDAHFNPVHHLGPCALFQACEQAGIPRVIQISAIGADEDAVTPYHKTKKLADDYLRSLDIPWIILQPSLIFGHDGASTKMFRRLAGLPVVPVPGRGEQMMQPVHVDDLAALVLRLLDEPGVSQETIAVVGPRALSYREYIEVLRHGMGKGKPLVINQPMAIMNAMAGLVQHIPGSTLTPDTLSMLQRGSTGDVTRFSELLGRMPRDPDVFITRSN